MAFLEPNYPLVTFTNLSTHNLPHSKTDKSIKQSKYKYKLIKGIGGSPLKNYQTACGIASMHHHLEMQ